MKPRTVLYIVALVLIVVFALANWALLAGTVELNLLIVRVQAPLGVLLVLIAAVIVLIDLGLQALNQRSWTRERQTLVKELDSYRLRAGRDDDSRLEALRVAMDRDLAVIRGQLEKLIASQTTPAGARFIAQNAAPPTTRNHSTRLGQ
jgi:uncharacterized integral membrane protein